MLFVIYRANHPELTYRGGQDPIVHLEADFHRVTAWADAQQVAIRLVSLSNAGALYAQFRANVAELGEVNWPAVAATDFQTR